jgi:hypothetical protein
MKSQLRQQPVLPVLCIDGNQAGYDAICKEARSLGWPRLWAEDLYVLDRGRLQKPDAPLEFAWAVRSTGTFLMFPGIPEDLELAKALLFNRDKRGCWIEQRYYWFGGTLLRSISLETVIERLKRFSPIPTENEQVG